MIQQRITKGLYAVGLFLIFSLLLLLPLQVHAEGSKTLTEKGGYRPYTERYGSATAGQKRRQVLYVAVKEGDTVCLGTSVKGAEGTPGTDSEIHINYNVTNSNPDGTNVYYQVDADDDAGFIKDRTQEAAGPQYSDTNSDGYTPIQVKVTSENVGNGIWTVEFYSTKLTGENPVLTKIGADENFVTNQKGGTVAAWDISVFPEESTTEQTGRVYADELFLNMGGNTKSEDVLKSIVYVYTEDHYLYEVDFNGMDPYGFVFYSNNRGLLYHSPSDTTGSLSSLYHSVLTKDNQVNGLTNHNIILNNIPTDETLDYTHKIFFNEPDTDIFPSAIGVSAGGFSDFKFTGDMGDGEAHAGNGGTFSFNYEPGEGSNVSSYQIKLDFGDGGIVTLSNTLTSGTNTIFWDGRDAKGNIVPAGTYSTGEQNISLETKGGEVHFPLIDVEKNRNGIKIHRLAPGQTSSETSPSELWKVYYNNVNDNPSRFSDGWDASISNWTSVAGGNNYSTIGTSSENGAMIFTTSNLFNWANTGNQAVLDLWTYVNGEIDSSEIPLAFEIVDNPVTVSFAGTKTVDGRAISQTYDFLVKENGKTVATGTSDLDGNITFTPITYREAGEHTYQITEVAGNEQGITYDSSTKVVTVSVHDNGGDLAADITYPDNADKVTFTNRYLPESTSVQLKAKKRMSGYELEGGDFAFELREGTTGENDPIQTKENDINGDIVFDALTFTKIGTYQYTITEENRTGDPHVNYDLTPRIVTIKVEDMGGHLAATVTPDNGSLTFHNIYQTSGQALITGYKELTGRALKEEEFTFNLYSCDVNGNITDQTPVRTTNTDAAGNITFDYIEYVTDSLAEGASETYYYCIKEEIPDPAVTSITYDEQSVLVKVTITNQEIIPEIPVPGADKEYELVTQVEYPNGDPVFKNTYTPASTTLDIELKKVLNSDSPEVSLKAEQFSFALYEGDGEEPLQTVKNQEDGTITFPITYTEAGTHQYIIKEVLGDELGIGYDSTAKKLSVTVTDDGNGTLTATPTWEQTTDQQDDNTFTNTYTITHNLMLADYIEGTNTLLSGSEYQIYEGSSVSGDPLSFRFMEERSFSDDNGSYTADVYRLSDPSASTLSRAGDTTTRLKIGDNKHIYIEGLPGTTYTIVKTASPSGYTNADELTGRQVIRTVVFSGADGELKVENFHEEQVTLPNPPSPDDENNPATPITPAKHIKGSVSTGDTTSYLPYIIGVCVSLLVIIAVLILRKRRR